MNLLETMSDLDLLRAWRQAARESARYAQARAELPGGSSRAKVTTANAWWKQAAESRDRYARELERRGISTQE